MADDPPRKPKLIIRDSVIANTPVGIHAPDGIEIDAQNVEFRNVNQPWNLGSNSTGSVRGTKIKDDPKLRGEDRSSVGWGKLKGPPLPVFCPNCKSIFASKNYVFAGQFWLLWENEEQCIKCGYERARLSDGTFNLSREIAVILSAPDITHTMLRAIQEIAQGAVSGVITPDEAVQRADKISPKIGKWLRAALVTVGLGALSILNNAAGIGSYLLTKEQTEAQRASRTDQLLEEILKRLDDGRAVPVVTQQSTKQDPEKQRGPVPPKEQAPSETGSIKAPSQHGRKPVRPPSRASRRGNK